MLPWEHSVERNSGGRGGEEEAESLIIWLVVLEL